MLIPAGPARRRAEDPRATAPRRARRPLRDRSRAQGRHARRHLAHRFADPQCGRRDHRRLEDRARHHAAEARRRSAARQQRALPAHGEFRAGADLDCRRRQVAHLVQQGLAGIHRAHARGGSWASAGRRTCTKTTWRNACRPTARASTRASHFAPNIASARQDGDARWIIEQATPLFEGPGGAFSGFIGSCVDITESEKAPGGARGDAEGRARGARGSGARRPIEGRIPRDGLARAAHAAQRHPRLGDAVAPAPARQRRTTGAASRPSSAMRASRRRSSATCWT